jgi:hypothetical protein
MKTIFIILFISVGVFPTQWQIPEPIQPYGLAITNPSFSGDNLRIYCGIYYSIYHDDIAYYDWSGTQWVYGGRLQGDVNTTEAEADPFITYDGQQLYYERSISGATAPFHLWVGTWNGIGFDNSTELNSQINSADCRCPSITQDGSKLYFSRGTPNGFKIYESTWTGSDWGTPVMLPQEVNGNDSHNKNYVTISPDGNEIYFTGAGSYYLWIAYSRKIGGVWQQWEYCDLNINISGKTSSDEALTYAPYETQELYFGRTGEGTLHALRSPVSVEPASLGQIKATYR